MKSRIKPLSMTRNVKSKIQVFREVELKGLCFQRLPKYSTEYKLLVDKK